MRYTSNRRKEDIDLSKTLSGFSVGNAPAPGTGLAPGSSVMARWIVRHSRGLIKNERQAVNILAAISILLVLAAAALYISQTSRPTIILSPVGDNPLLK